MRISSRSLVPKDIEGFRPGDVFGGNGFDAVYFRRQKVPESRLTDFDFLSLHNKEVIDHSKDLNADKWLVFLFERETGDEPEPNQVVYFSVYLHDAIFFAKNQVKAKSEGVMVKACKSGYSMMTKIMENAPEIQKERLRCEYKTFLEQYGDK
jgi:hypothetical protein